MLGLTCISLFINKGKSKLRLVRISAVEISDGQAKSAPGNVVAHIADVKTHVVAVRMEICLEEILDITLKSKYFKVEEVFYLLRNPRSCRYDECVDLPLNMA